MAGFSDFINNAGNSIRGLIAPFMQSNSTPQVSKPLPPMISSSVPKNTTIPGLQTNYGPRVALPAITSSSPPVKTGPTLYKHPDLGTMGIGPKSGSSASLTPDAQA